MDADIKLKHLFKIKYGKVCNLNENEKMSRSSNEQNVSGLTVTQNRPNVIAVSSVFPLTAWKCLRRGHTLALSTQLCL